MNHTCHALRCSVEVPTRLFMCLEHWHRLPAQHRAAVSRTYRRGQENDKNVSIAYMIAQTEAVLAMGIIDGVDAGALQIQRDRVDFWKNRVASGRETEKKP